jgi:hypothetical protein
VVFSYHDDDFLSAVTVAPKAVKINIKLKLLLIPVDLLKPIKFNAAREIKVLPGLRELPRCTYQ